MVRKFPDDLGVNATTPLLIHGSRQASIGPLGRGGLHPYEIAAITGHASLREMVRYTNMVDRERLAAVAMEKMKAGTSSVKAVAKFDKKRRMS